MTVKEFVDEVYASYNRDTDTNYVFFLGAGCSKSSGIPLAGELAIEWFFELKKEGVKFDRFIDEHIQDSDTNEKLKSVSQKEDIDDPLYDALAKLYFPLFEIVFPDMIDRQKEIQRLTEGKYPGLGYYNLAQLMRKKAFNVVITTNFDDLIYDALLYSGLSKRARVISHHHLSQFIDRGDTPHIIKLHGDAHLHPANDSQNTQEIDPTLAQSVQSLLNNSKLIVIGYSGGDESIAKLLSTVTRQATVYWCNQEPPTGSKLESWWNNLPHKKHVEEFDFDKIMNIFGDKFALEAPDFASFANTLKSQYDASLIKEAQEAIADKDIEELNSLSAQSWRAGEYDKALKLATTAMELAIEKYGENHPSTATSYNNIGLAWNSKGEYDTAIEYYEKALKITLATLGENHPSTAASYNNIGGALNSKGEYDTAIEYHEKALNILLATIGKNHPDTAKSYNNLGVAFYSKEEYNKAIEYYEKALKIQLATLGENHPDTAKSYNNIGGALDSKGEYDTAIEYHEKALNIRLATLGENHPDTATSYNNIGLAWDSKGEYDTAIEYYEKALKIQLATLGENHPDTATSYNNIGLAWDSKGEYDTAIEYYEKDLKITSATLGENHPSTATTYNYIGSAWDSKGEYDTAIEYYEKALKILNNVFPSGHPYIDITAESLELSKEKAKKDNKG